MIKHDNGSLVISAQLKNRLISAFVLGAFITITIFFARPVFDLAIVAACAIMLLEWYNMCKGKLVYLFIGILLISMPIASILLMSHYDNQGYFLFNFMLIISLIDTAAMAGGKYFKGPKLAPDISPNKTFSGLISAMLLAASLPFIYHYIFQIDVAAMIQVNLGLLSISILMFMLALMAQLSDLLISIFKRQFGADDSGTIIPGHGGVLDRMDSYVLCAPIVLMLLV